MAFGRFCKFIVTLAVLVAVTPGCGESNGETNMATIMGVGDSPEPVAVVRRVKPTPTPTPIPSYKPTTAPAPATMRRNMTFDVLRTQAIALVYEKKISQAVATFNSANRIKPGDPSIKMWLDAIKKSAELSQKAATDSKPGAAASSLMQLLFPGLTPPTTPGGARPMGMQSPREMPSPVAVDPALVF